MPQLVKGGKWVYGWCVVGLKHEIHIPPDASIEYGFQPGVIVLIIRGSRSSGGFALTKPEKLEISQMETRFIGQTRVGTHDCVVLPPEINVKSGERLLVVRGSWLALGFVKRGPIIDEALLYDEVQVFLPDSSFDE